jgi:hypothetical protein
MMLEVMVMTMFRFFDVNNETRIAEDEEAERNKNRSTENSL